MLKIQRRDDPNGRMTLKLDGSVRGPWVEELSRACDEALSMFDELALDFADVAFIDQEAVALIHRLPVRRVVLLHCSPFVIAQLEVYQP